MPHRSIIDHVDLLPVVDFKHQAMSSSFRRDVSELPLQRFQENVIALNAVDLKVNFIQLNRKLRNKNKNMNKLDLSPIAIDYIFFTSWM